MTLRELRPVDIDEAMDLSGAAGWNQTASDWQALLDVSPEGCLAIECDGRVAATATVVCYGNELAWIGMVLTHPDYRRRGFARALVIQALELAHDRGIAAIKLDATDQGRPLYQALGFRDEQPVERWGLGITDGPGGEDPDAAWAMGPPLSEAGGYLLHRPGTQAHYLGPCVADSPEIARRLFSRALETVGERGYFWDLLPENRGALALATQLGFSPLRKLTRMVYGNPAPHGDQSRVYAIAGFEWG